MTRVSPPSTGGERDELAPVRSAILDLARRDAARTLAAADAEAAATLARAEAEAGRLREDAQAEAAEDAAQLLGRERARHEREARATELRARGAAYEALLRRTRAAVRELAGEPAVHDRLVELARAALGPGASIRDETTRVVAELGGRRVEYSLEALAEEAVAQLLSAREVEP